MVELEREATAHVDDLDTAISLFAIAADLFSRLKQKEQSVLLQILAKRIIVDEAGQIIDCVLNSPFI